MNCDGLFHFTFRNTNPLPSALSNLGQRRSPPFDSKTIQIRNGNHFTAEQQQMLTTLINCMINEAKKLQ
jgi:hypothetical protein